MGMVNAKHLTVLKPVCNMSCFFQMMTLESHLEMRRGKEEWKRCQENVIDVMKKTLGKFFGIQITDIQIMNISQNGLV